MTTRLAYGLAVILSVALIAVSFTSWLPAGWKIDWKEAVAFVTGGWCVWLVVKEHIWNWPIGIANAAFSGVVFYEARFFADTWLQVVYIVLGLIGWYWWLYGGERKTELKMVHAKPFETAVLAPVAFAVFFGIRALLVHYNGAAPFLDALTTTLSLVAQYMLTRKQVENWLVWIVADILYVPMYFSRELYLMAILYLVFLVMAVTGYVEWLRRSRTQLVPDVHAPLV